MNRKLPAVSYQRSGAAFGVLRPDAALPLGGLTPRSSRGASRASHLQSGVKPPHSIVAALGLVVLTSATFAATLVTSSMDAGGQRSTSASYVNDGGVGWIGDISTATSPPETVKHGFIGQLYEVTSLAVTGTPSSVNEGSTSQLSGTATLDDTTVLALAGSDIAWGAYAWPIHDISAGGVATTDAVYANTAGSVNGYYLGATGSGSLLVLDSNPDNYGLYAGDGIADTWQVQYFGLNNPQAAPGADPYGKGMSNGNQFLAGFNPTNTAAYLHMISVVKLGNDIRLTYLGANGDTTYSGGPASRTNVLEFSTGTANGSYTNSFVTAGVTNILSGGTGLGMVTNMVDIGGATKTSRFYRVRVLVP